MIRFFVRSAAAVLALCVMISGEASAETKKFVVGFAQDTMASPWRAAQVHAVGATLAKYPNVEFVFTDAGGSTEKNIQDIKDLANRGIDLLFVSPRNRIALTPVISALHRKGLPVVLLTRRITGEAYTTFISPRDDIIGELAAYQIANKLHGNGKVLVLQGPPAAATAIARTKGFMSAIGRYPGIEVVAVAPANYLRAEAGRVVANTIAAGIEFDAIYAQNDNMAAGARIALQEARINPTSIAIIGVDYSPEARAAIRNGEQLASFTYPTCGEIAGETAMKILSGMDVPREIVVPSKMVTVANVENVATMF